MSQSVDGGVVVARPASPSARGFVLVIEPATVPLAAFSPLVRGVVEMGRTVLHVHDEQASLAHARTLAKPGEPLDVFDRTHEKRELAALLSTLEPGESQEREQPAGAPRPFVEPAR